MAAAETFRIVVGVDGSGPSLAALHWALEEARLRSGQVHIVTAWHYPVIGDAAGRGPDHEAFGDAAGRRTPRPCGRPAAPVYPSPAEWSSPIPPRRC